MLYLGLILIAYEIFHSNLNDTEFGVFSIMFLHNYNAKIMWSFVYILASFILSAYLINISEADT